VPGRDGGSPFRPEGRVSMWSSSSGSSPAGSVVAVGGDQPAGGEVGAESGAAVLLYTPAQAAALLQVPESWLRRRAAQRRVACTFLGKHLRFSRADLDAIVAAASTGVGHAPSTASHPAARSRHR
jgi:excisionase family DNA binding protein